MGSKLLVLVAGFNRYHLASTGNYNTSGVVGGGLVGYNYQFNQFVLGVEGDLTGSSNQGRFSSPLGFRSQNTQYGFAAVSAAVSASLWTAP